MKANEKSLGIVLFAHGSAVEEASLDVEIGRSHDNYPQGPSIILGQAREVLGETKVVR